jgi:DNA-binding Lrp family transcriptional regulator
MPTAYVLLNSTLGTEEEVIQKLQEIKSIKEVHATFGTYDILTKIETSTVEALRDIITKKIRNFDNVRSTLTLMGIDGQG